ncbi:hypothetical protein [Shewanella maritima]|uniref:hypothetical protein n=1 Tax=Shewanella maritima TaxID=2520507 RepID=UPI00373556C3
MRKFIALLTIATAVGAGFYFYRKQQGTSSDPLILPDVPQWQPPQMDWLNLNFDSLLSGDSDMQNNNPYQGEQGDPIPKGIRNNNPLNVEYSAANPWNGQTGSDGRFSTFTSAFYGIRAAARTLKTYRDKYGLDNVYGIIHRWAPPSDNNPTDKYIEFVAQKAFVAQGQQLTEADYVHVVAAMIHFENGYNPYELSEISAAVAAGFK